MAITDRKRRQLVGDAAKVLGAGEEVVDITTGVMETERLGAKQTRRGSLIITDRRLVFFTKKIGGHEIHEINYALIAGLDFKKGIAFGNLHLASAGDHINFSMIDKADVERIVGEIRKRITSPGAAAPPAPPTPEVPVDEQIRRLAGLRDDGLVSEDEFETKKRQLLGL